MEMQFRDAWKQISVLTTLVRSPVVVVLVVKGICVILLRYLSTSVGSYSCRARASEDSITSSARQESDFPVDIGYAWHDTPM